MGHSMEIETGGQIFILLQHFTNYVFPLDGYLEVYNPYTIDLTCLSVVLLLSISLRLDYDK